MRNKVLRTLFSSYSSGDRDEFLKAAEEIIRDEELKNNGLLANELRSSLYSPKDLKNSEKATRRPAIPLDKEKGLPLFEIKDYHLSESDIILNKQTQDQITKILIENSKKYVLNSHGLKPSQKILFFGPPGCGKTLAAQVISSLLFYPMIYVRFDAVISSYLGETSSNLRKIFDFAEKGEWVIFFDEFDIIGKSRNNVMEHGEMVRLVNNFLQMIDNYKGEGIIITATNHQNLLDNALWRRFDEIVYFGLPDEDDIVKLFIKNLQGVSTKNIDYYSIAKMTKGLSPADIERICLNSIKDSILRNKFTIDSKQIQKSINDYKIRMGHISKYSVGNCDDQTRPPWDQ